MRAYTAVIADDEAYLRTGLAGMLTELWPELEILGLAENGIQALEMIRDRQPDVAFLDIQMPGITGVAVAKKVSAHCRVVFVTAYDQYAVQAFEAEALDYILKPVDRQRLAATVDRLKKRLGRDGEPGGGVEAHVRRAVQILENRSAQDYLRLVRIKTGSEIRLLPVADIFYFKAEDKYTVVQAADREYLIKTPIKELETRLDPEVFWRVHRSAIVNIDRVGTVGRSFTNRMVIRFDGVDATVPVSRSREHLFKSL